MTNKKDASVVSVGLGEVRELELRIRELAKPRSVHLAAIGLDGKPMEAIYVQLEDLRHPGDAGSYVNVDLDHNGAGTLTVVPPSREPLCGQWKRLVFKAGSN